MAQLHETIDWFGEVDQQPDTLKDFHEKLRIYKGAKIEVFAAFEKAVGEKIIANIERHQVPRWRDIADYQVGGLEIDELCFLFYKKTGDVQGIMQIMAVGHSVETIVTDIGLVVITGSCSYCKNVFHNVADCQHLQQKQCKSCGEMGHLISHCKNKECQKCGRKGHDTAACKLKKCLNCERLGHDVATCKFIGGARCAHCNKLGHNAANCICVNCGNKGRLMLDMPDQTVRTMRSDWS